GLNVVPYDGTRRGFVFRTAGYSHGSVHYFGVRARNSNGVAELNTYTTARSTAKATGPSDATTIGIVHAATLVRG
ncbi:MAG: hypothetical protein AABZ47_10140, partial [Planctomycetota bacterium]